ncbi:hypothetical protein BGZ93_003926, partial [Podila epicladia]
DKCQCPISTSGKPVCGGKLDNNCYADPTAIYYCPYGDGSKPKVLKQCFPGTQCQTDKYDNANCGYESCKCSGYAEACSDQFPDYCKSIVPNSVYKCENGFPKLKETCDKYKECVATASDAFCASKKCKCPKDGYVCGDIFPLSCRIPASTIYQCNFGEDPVEYKKCEPGTCSTSILTLEAAEVFDKDKCIDDCKCISSGKVCGSTFSPKCKYIKPDWIYQCDGAGKAPNPLYECDDKCVTQLGGDVCSSADKCKCKDSYDTCGSAFKDCTEITIVPEQLYTCTAGERPAAKNGPCVNGCLEIPRADDKCKVIPVVDNCKCADSSDTCGSAFKDCTEIKIVAEQLYSCTKGQPPVAKDGPCVNGCLEIPRADDKCK